MKKIIYWIILVWTILSSVILLYLFNSDFNFFIKKLKYWENFVINKEKITDDYNFNPDKTCDCSQYNKELLSKIDELEKKLADSKAWTWWLESKVIDNIITDTIKETDEQNKWFSEAIKNFSWNFKWLNFQEKAYDDYYKIFDLTDEYLWNYLTYTSDNIEIYFFPDSTFDEMYKFFEVLSYDQYFSLNKVNNFWWKTFFINKDTKDDYIRLVLEYDNKIFWLKVKNSYYNNVKNVLNNL